MPLTISSVMFFPSSLGVLGLSTSYNFTRVTQLVLISHQLVIRNRPEAKKKKKIHEALYKVAPAEHPIKCVPGQSLSHLKKKKKKKKKKAGTKQMVFCPTEKVIAKRCTLTLRTDQKVSPALQPHEILHEWREERKKNKKNPTFPCVSDKCRNITPPPHENAQYQRMPLPQTIQTDNQPPPNI